MSVLRILHVIPSMDPVLGGTVEALLQLVRASQASAQQHEILTLDDPLRVDGFGHGLPIHAVGPAARFYGNTPNLDRWLRTHLSRYDCAVIHGCWQYHGLATFQACRRQGIPYLQYPHGMLDPWFKHRYPLKHLKKWLYWPWAEYRILKHAARVVFTCEQEKQLSATSFWLYRVEPVVIPLGIRKPEWGDEALRQAVEASFPQLKDKRLVTFLSRIHEKKGVDLLVEAALRLQQTALEGEGPAEAMEKPVTLVIAGPCENQPWLEQLKVRAKELPMGGPIASIEWLPMIRAVEKWGLLHASEAFILPSHQENFGMVVAEALACGTPTLLSDKVNIWQEVVNSGAGWVAPDTVDGTVTLLQQWLRTDACQRSRFRLAASACFQESFEISRNAIRFFELLGQVCQTQP